MKRQHLATILTILAIVGIGAYLWVHREELSSIEIAAPAFMIICVAGILANLLATTLMSVLMLRRLDCAITVREAWWLCVIATTANLFTPARAGAGVRAVYLKRVYGLSFPSFVATLFGYYVLSLVICSVAACVALGVLWMNGALPELDESMALVVFGAAGSLVGSLVLACLPRIGAGRNWILDKLSKVTHAWHELRSERRVLGRSVALSAMQFATFAVTFWGAYRALGIEVSPFAALALAAFGCLSSLISVTPGAMGVYEAVVAFTGTVLGLTVVESLAAALLWRATLVACLALLAPWGARVLALRKVSEKVPEEVT